MNKQQVIETVKENIIPEESKNCIEFVINYLNSCFPVMETYHEDSVHYAISAFVVSFHNKMKHTYKNSK
jgi:hypothetical protein